MRSGGRCPARAHPTRGGARRPGLQPRRSATPPRSDTTVAGVLREGWCAPYCVTGFGCVRVVVVPSPRWPWPFTPQARSESSWISASEWSLPAASIIADAIAGRPLSDHLLRETHTLLMRGVRGEDEVPGTYRSDQNWIGAPGCAIEEASFVPIVPEHLSASMHAWVQYLNDEAQPDAIVQLAVAHVEFEALHSIDGVADRAGENERKVRAVRGPLGDTEGHRPAVRCAPARREPPAHGSACSGSSGRRVRFPRAHRARRGSVCSLSVVSRV